MKGEGLTLTANVVDYLGRTVHYKYTATFDGKDHPFASTVDGKPGLTQDAMSWQ